MDNLITQEELKGLFGTHIPIDAIMAMQNWKEGPDSLGTLRVYLELRAKSWAEQYQFDKPI